MGETPVIKQFTYDNNIGLLLSKNNNGIIETNSWNSNDRKLTTLLPNGKQIIKYLNTKEQIIKIESYTGTINFELDAIGNQTKITTANGVISRIYNLKNQVVQEIEPSRGTLNNTFDKFGRLIASFDSRGESSSKIEYSYDLINRLSTKTIHSANQANTVYSFNYDNSENGIGKLSNITGNNQHIQYEYDQIARLKKQKITTDNISFEFEYGYNNFNQVISKKLPDNTIINYEYSNYNIDLLKVNEGAENNPIFELQDNDAIGRMKEFKLGENITINKSFDFTGNLVLQKATKIGIASFNHYEHNYTFDLINNNLMKDEDLLNEKKEIYEYDSHERLTKVFNGNINISDEDLPTILNMDYAENGNIQNKTDIGEYEYQNNRLKKISNDNNQISTTTQNITYSSFNKPTKITEGSNEMEFTYNCFDEKIKTVYKIDGNVVKTTYYLPDFQKTLDESQIEKTTTFIKKGRLYMAAIVKTEENNSTIFINADRLGSISQIFDNTGNLLQEFSYDAWGKQTIIQNNSSQTEPLLNLGYTGHEHLSVFNLIDMKGRFYDPQIGQMLSPDPLISEIENAQTYNKYSYVFNNPFKYTDPTGYYGAAGPGDISLEEEKEMREREERELEEFLKSQREKGVVIGKEIVIDGNEEENKKGKGGQEANPDYEFVLTIIGSQAMGVEKAAELANKGGQTANWLNRAQGISKWGGAALNVIGTGISIYNVSQTGQVKLSDAVGLLGTGLAITGLAIASPVIGGAGLVVGAGMLIFGGFMNNTTIYDNNNGGVQFNYNK